MTDRPTSSDARAAQAPAHAADDPRNVAAAPVDVRPATLRSAPDAPRLVAPRPDAEIDGGTALFQWRARDGATGYRLQVARDAACTDLLFDAPVGDTTEMTLYDTLPEDGQTFFWRVRGEAPQPTGWSAAVPFVAGAGVEEGTAASASSEGAPAKARDVPAPVAPVEGGPADGSAATFEWAMVPGARGYRVQAAADESFDDLVFDVRTERTNQLTVHQFLPEDGSTFYWRVRGKRPRGASAWSAPAPFRATTDEEMEAYTLARETEAAERASEEAAERLARATEIAEAESPLRSSHTTPWLALAVINIALISFGVTLYVVFSAALGT
jgi:hypothetical protein